MRLVVDGFFELLKRIVDSQENSFASRSLHMLYYTQHPLYGLDFDAQIQRRIESASSSISCNQFRIRL